MHGQVQVLPFGFAQGRRSAQDDKQVQVLRSAQDDKQVQVLRSAQDDKWVRRSAQDDR